MRLRPRGGPNERPLRDAPAAVRAGLAAALLGQVLLSALQPAPVATAQALPALPSTPVMRAAGLGDPIPLAQLLTLYVQAFDNQPGISIPFLRLDYGRVAAWLEAILALDPRGQYPLMLASQLYAQVPDPGRQRLMLDLVYRQFAADPNRRWPWLAHASIMARHRLGDAALALRYAKALREDTSAPHVPGWARQMEIFLYEDIGEHDAARALLGGLLASGTVTDAHELRFLTRRLEQMHAVENSSAASERRLRDGARNGVRPSD